MKTNKTYCSLANHLGNVLAVISDKKVAIPNTGNTLIDYFNAEITSISDYYPFGMQIQKRSYTATSYRFAFQGQEGDDEIAGKGNSYAFKYRIHDARLGRFLSRDPLAAEYSYNSPYAFSENRVIDAFELEGLEKVIGSKTVTTQSVSSSIDFEYTDGNDRGVDKVVTKTTTVVKDYNLNKNEETGETYYMLSSKIVTIQFSTTYVNEDGKIINTTNQTNIYTSLFGVGGVRSLPADLGPLAASEDFDKSSDAHQGIVNNLSTYKVKNKVSPIQDRADKNERAEDFVGNLGDAITLAGAAMLVMGVGSAEMLTGIGIVPGAITAAAGVSLFVASKFIETDKPEEITLKGNTVITKY